MIDSNKESLHRWGCVLITVVSLYSCEFVALSETVNKLHRVTLWNSVGKLRLNMPCRDALQALKFRATAEASRYTAEQ